MQSGQVACSSELSRGTQAAPQLPVLLELHCDTDLFIQSSWDERVLWMELLHRRGVCVCAKVFLLLSQHPSPFYLWNSGSC